MTGLVKPSERFRQEIEPALADYQAASPPSERLANNLAKAIDHHLEWTFSYYEKVDASRLFGAKALPDFKSEMFKQCPSLRMMSDLSDSAHHRFLTRTPSQPLPLRTVENSTDAYRVVAGELWVPRYHERFLPAAIAAVDFWRHWQD
jgi:hypothetical protein